MVIIGGLNIIVSQIRTLYYPIANTSNDRDVRNIAHRSPQLMQNIVVRGRALFRYDL